MDQLRTALGWLKRYHFWVLSIVVVGVAVGCWYSAAAELTKQFEAHQSTIKREFDNQAKLARNDFHANTDINEQQEKEINKQADSVLATWQALYDRQQQEVLNWPEEFGPSFLQRVEPLKFEEKIPSDLRNQYFNYIKNYYPKLPAIVDAQPITERARGGNRSGRAMFGREGFGGEAPTRRGGDDEAELDNHLVEWSSQDQENVRRKLEWSKTPSSLEIWVTQEDLWVYRTLLQIVADTNEGATRRTNAPVRVIESLQVGREAGARNSSSGRIYVPDTSSTTGDRSMMEGMSMMEPGISRGEMGPSYGYGAAEGGDASADRQTLLSDRYLEKNGQPISVAGRSNGPNEFGVEYKRLPVRMELEMDQRAIPELIANCANQPLQVEVQQVRINPAGESGRNRRKSFNSGRDGVNAFDAQPHIANVIIQGVIYILNEPNTSTLQIAGT